MRKLKEIGIGSFRPGREPHGRHIKSIDLAGPTSNADSVISQRMQGLAYEDEEYEEDEETILEYRIYKNGKYCLVETLEKIEEFSYADEINSMMSKLSRQQQKRQNNIDNLPSTEEYIDSKNEENVITGEDPLDEFSGAVAAGGGPAVPVGYTAKGKPETPSERRKRHRFNIKKSYPYTNLAKPPKSTRRKRRKK